MYDPKGRWFREGHGVDPDIEVIEDPSEVANGTDPQLARAIREVQDRIAKAPKLPTRPAPEKRRKAEVSKRQKITGRGLARDRS